MLLISSKLNKNIFTNLGHVGYERYGESRTYTNLALRENYRSFQTLK